jgi:hypothetical protein
MRAQAIALEAFLPQGDGARAWTFCQMLSVTADGSAFWRSALIGKSGSSKRQTDSSQFPP